ncbi:3-methyl-2-oxobutanoate hydroxymethyltransferase [Pavlovales sp. CCMP2436]|nr:3-methyl-2-oxobutanoate hydroxymethyltransferase [Pavlovales sp. CCMP2436]|mmetsp:Transcript_38191/g.89805  ORF Transcript_38191/g.89805 Transcript_38191/m.89805 type:complete len:250 (-) Transcript_38191:90-839(-)
MVVLGYDSTTPVTMEEMVHHTKAVRRGAPLAYMVADLPFGAYLGCADALQNGARLLKEGGADAVKLEGGRRVLPQVQALTDAGMAVMGHVGLTPQTHAALGGYTVQGKSAAAACELLADARALQAAGCFAIVLEMVPHKLATLVTAQLRIPTIGIGAGVGTSGQVQVFHDLLGLYDKFQPKFSARYASVGAIAERALAEYVADVAARRFPGPQHSFAMPEDELHAFEQSLESEPAEGDTDCDGERSRAS